MKQHFYNVQIEWTGNQGSGTSSYRDYSRAHECSAGSKPVIPGSSDPAFWGDPARWNPEELLIASLSACHQLWYLHLSAVAGIRVQSYVDQASGILEELQDGSGRFISVTLRPRAVLSAGDDGQLAGRLHKQAAQMCFIANSVSFPVQHEPTFAFEQPEDLNRLNA